MAASLKQNGYEVRCVDALGETPLQRIATEELDEEEIIENVKNFKLAPRKISKRRTKKRIRGYE